MTDDHRPKDLRTENNSDPAPNRVPAETQADYSGPPPAKQYIRPVGKKIENPYELKKLPSAESRIPLGSGVIVGEIGEGGMARVYKIWNQRLEVFRAVKILLPNMNKETRGRFETESKITAKLHHPNLLDVHNVGDWEGLPFIEMEFIDGVTLDTLIKRYTPLPPAVISAIGVMTSRALAYAHNQEIMLYGKVYRGIIHRDLKPQNIMVSSKGVLKLMDFGIARPSEVSIHTAPGKVVGTLMYLSPEQLDKDGIDARTDVYSFGAILYEMLSGRRAFPQKSMSLLLQAKAENVYEPLKSRTPSIKGELATLSDTCMSRDPEKRIQTAEDLVRVIETIHTHTTSLRPEEVLAAYVRNPGDFVAPPSAAIPPIDNAGESADGKSKQSILSIVLAGFGGVVLVIGLVFVGYIVWDRFVAGEEGGSLSSQQTLPEPATNPSESGIAPPLETGSDVSKPDVEEKKTIKPKEIRSEHTVRREKAEPATEGKAGSDPIGRKESTPEILESAEPALPESEPVKIPPKSRRELLLEKYKTTEPLEAAAASFRTRKYAEILDILKDYKPEDETLENRANLYRLQALVSLKQWNSALTLVSDIQMEDAQLEYLHGLILRHEQDYSKALSHMENALSKRSILRDPHSIREDALFATAGLHEKVYESTGADDALEKARHYWRMVKQVYRRDPTHSRYKLASQKLVDLGE